MGGEGTRNEEPMLGQLMEQTTRIVWTLEKELRASTGMTLLLAGNRVAQSRLDNVNNPQPKENLLNRGTKIGTLDGENILIRQVDDLTRLQCIDGKTRARLLNSTRWQVKNKQKTVLTSEEIDIDEILVNLRSLTRHRVQPLQTSAKLNDEQIINKKVHENANFPIRSP